MYLEITILCIYKFLILYGWLFGVFFFFILRPLLALNLESVSACDEGIFFMFGVLNSTLDANALTLHAWF